MAKPEEKKVQIKTEEVLLPAAFGGISLPSLSIDPLKSNIGEQFGGSHPVIELAPGESSGYLVYERESECTFPDDNGAPRLEKVYLFQDPFSGEKFAGPVSAIFSKNMRESQVQPGDIVRLSRWQDASKKQGKGAGKPMRVFSVTVYVRYTEKKQAVEGVQEAMEV
jgi:hypothetical protein